MLPAQNTLDLTSLSFMQRVLLSTDGTVTDLVSLYTGEPIQVTKLKQQITPSMGPVELQLTSAELLLEREILLSGAAQHYIYAKSFFVMSRMAPDMQAALQNTTTPIGVLWQRARLETFREVIQQTILPMASLQTYFPDDTSGQLLSRSYLIYHRDQPLGMITEQFPRSFFID